MGAARWGNAVVHVVAIVAVRNTARLRNTLSCTQMCVHMRYKRYLHGITIMMRSEKPRGIHYVPKANRGPCWGRKPGCQRVRTSAERGRKQKHHNTFNACGLTEYAIRRAPIETQQAWTETQAYTAASSGKMTLRLTFPERCVMM